MRMYVMSTLVVDDSCTYRSVPVASHDLVASQATKTLELSYGNTRQLIQIKRLGRLLHKFRGCGRKQTSHVPVYCRLS